MVVLQHIKPLGLAALTLSSRGAGWQEQKHPQIHPHLWDGYRDLGFPTSRLLAILNGYVMDQHPTSSTHFLGNPSMQQLIDFVEKKGLGEEAPVAEGHDGNTFAFTCIQQPKSHSNHGTIT